MNLDCFSDVRQVCGEDEMGDGTLFFSFWKIQIKFNEKIF